MLEPPYLLPVFSSSPELPHPEPSPTRSDPRTCILTTLVSQPPGVLLEPSLLFSFFHNVATSGTNFLRPNATYRRLEYYLTDAVAPCARSPMSSRRPMFYHSIFLFNPKTIWVPRRHFSHLPWPDAHQPLQAPHNLAVGLPCFAIAYIFLSLLYMCTRTNLLYAYLLE